MINENIFDFVKELVCVINYFREQGYREQNGKNFETFVLTK
jgi:hypothetical protein